MSFDKIRNLSFFNIFERRHLTKFLILVNFWVQSVQKSHNLPHCVPNKSGLDSNVVAFDSYSPGIDRFFLGIECHSFHDDDLSEKSQDKQNQCLKQSHPSGKTTVDDVKKQIENVEGVETAPKSHEKLCFTKETERQNNVVHESGRFESNPNQVKCIFRFRLDL